MKNTCPRTHEEVLLYHDQALDADSSLLFEEHLEHCSCCRDALSVQEQLDAALLDMPRPTLHESDVDRILQSVHQRQTKAPVSTAPPHPSITNRTPRLLLGAILAAAAALILWVMVPWMGGSSKPEEPLVVKESPDNSDDKLSPQAKDPQPILRDAPELAMETLSNDSLQIDEDILRTSKTKQDRRLQNIQSFIRETVEMSPMEALAQASIQFPSPDAFVRGLSYIANDDEADAADSSGWTRAIELLGAVMTHSEFPAQRRQALSGIERCFRLPDRTAVVLDIAHALDSTDRQQILSLAAQDSALATEALSTLATIADEAALNTVERWTLKWLRSANDRDRRALRDVIAHLKVETPKSMRLLLALFDEGAPADLLSVPLARLEDSAISIINDSIGNRGPLASNEAIILAGLQPRTDYLDSLASSLSDAKSPATLLEVLVRVPGVAPFDTLAQLLDDDELSQWRQSLVRESFVTLLQTRTPSEVAPLITAMTESSRSYLLSLSLQLEAPRATELLLEIAQNTDLSGQMRARAILNTPTQEAPWDRDLVMAWLKEEKQRFQSESNSAEVLGSLLISVYRHDGRSGLRDAYDRLGVESSKRSRLTRLTQRNATRRDPHLAKNSVASFASFLVFDVDSDHNPSSQETNRINGRD